MRRPVYDRFISIEEIKGTFSLVCWNKTRPEKEDWERYPPEWYVPIIQLRVRTSPLIASP